MESRSTKDKALEINLDRMRHGTFAEIGAGQEVAGWFFRVGGAAGTVAKTMSAYDMKFSDAVYGPAQRYVSRERLLSMLDHEYGLLIERLDATRGETTTFFAFADTVAARSHSRRDRAHGWLGIRFQHEPRATPSQLVLHANLFDTENIWQQQAIGIAGVNLVHGAIYRHRTPLLLIASLLDQLSRERIDVDLLDFSGPAFESVDNRLMSLALVQQGLTDAAMFHPDGRVVDPAEGLYKRSVLVERGAFRPVNRLHVAILERARERFVERLGHGHGDPLTLFELSVHDLDRPDDPTQGDFLERVDALGAVGGAILVSRFGEYYALTEYLARYTDRSIGLAVGVPTLQKLFDEHYYRELRGGLLEGLGRLFSGDTSLYAYPTREAEGTPLVTADTIAVPESGADLLGYLRKGRWVEPLEPMSEDFLSIDPERLLDQIRTGDPAWEGAVSPRVADVIRKRSLFGYRSKR
jgi:hypothetical protein